jgi:hypothetical protein
LKPAWGFWSTSRVGSIIREWLVPFPYYYSQSSFDSLMGAQ